MTDPLSAQEWEWINSHPEKDIVKQLHTIMELARVRWTAAEVGIAQGIIAELRGEIGSD